MNHSDWDVGSIFPLPADGFFKQHDDRSNLLFNDTVLLSLCRESLFYVAQTIKAENKSVMIPAYTCKTVIDPFEQSDWICCYYGIKDDLRIDQDSFLEILNSRKPQMVVFHPYYGCDLNPEEKALLKKAKESGAIVVEDLTQSIYLNKDDPLVDYYVGSLRKWYPIPDGSFLYSRRMDKNNDWKNLPEYEEFVEMQKDSMYLRGQYYLSGDNETKQISIRMNKRAVRYISEMPISLHRMSEYGHEILLHQDELFNQRSRIENYHTLHELLCCNSSIRVVKPNVNEVVSSPLYFPVFADDRTALQKTLAMERIYAPILWPIPNEDVLINRNVEHIYSHILLIPVDQRYERDDMERIAGIINTF